MMCPRLELTLPPTAHQIGACLVETVEVIEENVALADAFNPKRRTDETAGSIEC